MSVAHRKIAAAALAAVLVPVALFIGTESADGATAKQSSNSTPAVVHPAATPIPLASGDGGNGTGCC